MYAVAITAAGGGHTGRAVALAERLYGKFDLLFLVSRGDRWSRSKLEKYGQIIEVPRIRSPNESLAKAAARLLPALLSALRRVPRELCVFVSMGAGLSIPAAVAAWLKGVRVYNVESIVRFVRPSLAARVLRPFSDVTVLHWEEQLHIHPSGRVYGPIYERPKYPVRDEGYVLVTGGSYGFKALFDSVSNLGLENVVLQTGQVDPEPYRRRHPGWRVFRFSPDFGRWLAGARVVVTHFGQTAVDAALTYRKPTVIVYNPEWRTAAGLEDARILARKLNAVLVENPIPAAIRVAIEEAVRRKPPSYINGGDVLAREMLEICEA